MINSQVLVLNRSFLPVNVTTVRRAFCLIYADIAHAVGEDFQTFDFQSWSELSVARDEHFVGLIGRRMKIPRVIVLLHFDRFPKRNVKFNRYNIFLRDNNTCQYCGGRYNKNQMNLDHVVPRSQGGKSSWSNIVCCCIPCNMKKGGRTPLQAGIKLLRRPTKPSWFQCIQKLVNTFIYNEWKPFLNPVNHSYWNVELDHD